VEQLLDLAVIKGYKAMAKVWFHCAGWHKVSAGLQSGNQKLYVLSGARDNGDTTSLEDCGPPSLLLWGQATFRGFNLDRDEPGEPLPNHVGGNRKRLPANQVSRASG
jgi:hypothetical protein